MNLNPALQQIRSTASSTIDQGRRFERLFRVPLLSHLGEFRYRLAHVWLWQGWPGREDGSDTNGRRGQTIPTNVPRLKRLVRVLVETPHIADGLPSALSPYLVQPGQGLLS